MSDIHRSLYESAEQNAAEQACRADRLQAERDAALGKLAAIRAEHQPDGDYGYSTQCTACGTMWPCNTDAILNGKGEPTT